MNKTAHNLSLANKGRIVSFEGPECPYCGDKSMLREESFIYKTNAYSGKNLWVCRNYPTCNAYVGTHGHGSWMNFPLGRLAGPELRKLKTQAHFLFDPFWKTKTKTREQMYSWFQQTMNMNEMEAHIGELDEDQCQQLIEHLNNYYGIIKLKTA